MQRSRLPSVVRQLLNEVPDADLLERYAQGQSDDAFAQLVARYSRLVWGQCRNLLANDADADDAFQATFLTLARSVAKLKPGLPLGPWLHGVAFRVCKNAQRAKARRTKRERASAVSEASRPVADSQWESAFAAVAEEVQKLPESQRAAFVLCCIEGRATTEAAASLGQKLGTFSARLSRAKQTLLDRLAKRGLGAGVLALGGVTGSVAVAPAALISRTLALIPSGVVVPSSVQVLMQGVTGMTMIRIKLLAAGVMIATGFGLSVGGGWSGEATAQYVPPGIAKAPPDPNLEKLKADLEKAKAELAKAEAAARDQDRTLRLRITMDMAPKYEYEPLLGKGFTTQAFEAKLAEREKAGWEFLGQVSFDTSKDRGGVAAGNKDGMTPCLVFRKKPPVEARALWTDLDALRVTPLVASPAPKVAKPSDPVGPAPGGVTGAARRPGSSLPPGPGGSGPFPGSGGAPPKAIPLRSTGEDPFAPAPGVPPAGFGPVVPGAALPTPTVVSGGPILPLPTPGSPPPPGIGGTPPKASPPPSSNRDPSPDPSPIYPGYGSDLKAQSYLDRIAELEKLVEQLRVKGPTPAVQLITVKFTKDDFGTWETTELAGILLRLLPDKVNGGDKIGVVMSETILQVTGTPEAIAEVKALLKKLKK